MFRACRSVGEGFMALGERRTELEFSRTVEANDVGREGLELAFEATAREREALARRFDLLGLERFVVQARLRLAAGERIGAKVTLEADVIQSCVVTLEPVRSLVGERFEATFAEGADAQDAPEVEVDPAAADPPERIVGGKLELGELAAQHLSLSIDPYPRRVGAELDPGSADVGREDRPFAVLSKLAGRRA
jgi:uncharacterized metal-binding protein YceD (DUF177 family)